MKDMCDEVNDVIQEQKQLINKGFENLEKTKEYVERSYFGKSERDFRNFINLNQFWVDLASHIIKNADFSNFLSSNFIYATQNHSEMILALSFTDLSHLQNNYQMNTLPQRRLAILAENSNLLIFTK